MAVAKEEIRINVEPEVFFAVVSDYERYPEFLKDMENAEVLSRHDGLVEARFTANFIKRVTYTLRLQERPPTSVEWSLIEGPFKVSDGGWRLERLEDGSTLAKYHIEVQVNAFVPKSVSTRVVATTVPALLAAFKARAEALHA